MNSKERVHTILAHQEADMVPLTNRYTSEIASQLADIIGLTNWDSFSLEVELGHDMLSLKEIGISNSYYLEANKQIDDNLYICDFGILKKKVYYQGGYYLEIVKHPLADLDKFYSFKLPDLSKQKILQDQFKYYRDSIERYRNTHVIVGGVTATIFEASQMLRGMDKIMVDLVENQDFLEELMDKLVDYNFKVGKRLIELGVDIIYIGDDAGMQTGMLISPELWRKFLKPRYDYLFREWKKINKNIFFAFHSDGNIQPIIGDLVEIGLDILASVQPGIMDDHWLKKEFGEKLTFWGGINIQKTIPFGTPGEVVNEVKDRILTFGKDGGFIIGPSNNVQPNIRSIDNIFIYYWACRKFGKYGSN